MCVCVWRKKPGKANPQASERETGGPGLWARFSHHEPQFLASCVSLVGRSEQRSLGARWGFLPPSIGPAGPLITALARETQFKRG